MTRDNEIQWETAITVRTATPSGTASVYPLMTLCGFIQCDVEKNNRLIIICLKILAVHIAIKKFKSRSKLYKAQNSAFRC